jgi:hypothetical protein
MAQRCVDCSCGECKGRPKSHPTRHTAQDGSGRVDAEELQTALARLGLGLKRELVDVLFAAIDADGRSGAHSRAAREAVPPDWTARRSLPIAVS